MPHLSQQISAAGPILDLLVAVSEPRAQALHRLGQPVPLPVQIRGLIDTGASCTCVDPSALHSLNLTPTGTASIVTPSTGASAHVVNQFDVSIVLVHPQMQFVLDSVAVIESQLSVQGFHALIGRDILSQCLLIYDGPSGLFTLSF